MNPSVPTSSLTRQGLQEGGETGAETVIIRSLAETESFLKHFQNFAWSPPSLEVKSEAGCLGLVLWHLIVPVR